METPVSLSPLIHRPLYRRGAPVFGQQRNVQIDAALGRHAQHLRRQDTAIGHHHDQFGGQVPDLLLHLFGAQGLRLVDRQIMLQRQLFDRRSGEDLLAAHRLILAGEHAAYLMPCFQNGSQAGGGNVRRAHKQNAHYSSSSSISSG